MKVRKLLSMLVALVMAVSVLLTGCGGAAGDNTQGTTTAAAGESTTAPAVAEGPQEVTINLGNEPPQMNTFLSTDVSSFTVTRHVFEGLIRQDQQSKPVAGVAESWDITPDGLTYTFHLRNNAKWSDGSNVTAKDFDFGWKMLLTPSNAAPYAAFLYMIKGAEDFNTGKSTDWSTVGIKVKDDYTLEVTLVRPTPYFLDICAFGVTMPVKEEFYNTTKSGDAYIYGTEADKLIYNGPWVIESWQHEDHLVLKKNPNYWNAGDVKLDKITMRMINDSNTAYNSFVAGELDMVGLPGSLIAQAQSDGYALSKYQDGATFYFEFNTKDKVVSNKNIRKALTYAIDRQTLVTNVFKDGSLPALAFTHPVVAIAGSDKPFHELVGDIIKDNNSDEAKQLLAQGLKELGISSVPKLQMLTDDSDIAKRDGAVYQEYWKKNLGIDVEIVSMPFKSRLQRMEDKDFQIVLGGWGPDYNDPMTFLDVFETGNGNNHTSYSNPEYDKLLNEMRVEADNAKRIQEGVAAEKLLLDDMPLGPIYFRSRNYLLQPWFSGVVRDPLQDINLYWAAVDNSKK